VAESGSGTSMDRRTPDRPTPARHRRNFSIGLFP
jgi:hypothetical protein